MECNFEIELKEPDASDILFRPHVNFRIIQLNMTPDCYTEGDIDNEINALIKKIEGLKEKAKKKLKTANLRHDKMLSERE